MNLVKTAVTIGSPLNPQPLSTLAPNRFSYFPFLRMDLQDLARRQARNPRLILVQLLIEALLNNHLSRQDLALFQDVSCAVLSICGMGWVNECLLELFIASYGVVVLAAWTMPQIPDTLEPLHVPMNPGHGVSLQPLSRIVLGPFRESIAFKAAAMMVPLGRLIVTFERTWPEARLQDPLYKLMLRTLKGSLVRVQELNAMHEQFPTTQIEQLHWNKPRIDIDEEAWYQVLHRPCE